MRNTIKSERIKSPRFCIFNIEFKMHIHYSKGNNMCPYINVRVFLTKDRRLD